ncbi:MAG: hypothetical protein U0R69_13040 [Gaiellales bacterium]
MSASRSQEREAPAPTVDFDLHGLVGIRLLDATDADARVVRRQLGPLEAALHREPDILIRFVDSLHLSSRLRYLGVDDAGFTDDAFLVLRARHKARARVRLPLHEVGRSPEIVCERGTPSVPFLIPIVNLTALSKGVLPLHASAFQRDGVGIVTTGWSKGGKTEALLAFMEQGASYVADEWVYVSADGRRAHGIPEPIRLWDWHLRELPARRTAVARGDRARLGMLRTAVGLERWIPRQGGLPPSKALRRTMPVLRRQLHVDVPPERLFDRSSILRSTGFDRLFFVASAEGAQMHVEPVDPLEVADRMAFSLEHERLDFMACYEKFRFAFPDVACPGIESAVGSERDLLRAAFAGKQAHTVVHPYPVSLRALFEAMEPHCRPDGG